MMRVDDAIRLIVLLCVCLAAGLGNHQAIAKFYSPDYIFEEAKRPDPMVTDWLDQLKNGRVEPARLVYLLSLVPNPQGTFIFTRPLITVVDLLERNRFSVWDCSKARLWNRFVYSHKFENRKPFNGFDQAYVLNENLRLYIRTTLELVAQECVRLGARIYKPDDVLPKPKPEDPKKELQFYAIINGQEYMWRLGNVTEKLVADQRSLDKELFNRPSVLEQFFFDEISDNQRAIGERLAESKSMNSILFPPPTTTKKPVRVFVKPTQTEPIEAVVESGEASGSNNVDSKPIEASEDSADLAEP